MDVDTTQKLSFQPVCPPPKECHEWARKACFKMPTLPIDCGTTYNLSYLGNCGAQQRPTRPACTPKIISCCEGFDGNTVYKESYMPTCGDVRPTPCKPMTTLNCCSDIKMDPDTMYNLAYPGHFRVCRQRPIIPCPRSLLGEGPMQDLTTQKHDFVCKPICRRPLIRPCSKMLRTSEPLDNQTTAGLSYMCPVPFCPVASCKPKCAYKMPDSISSTIREKIIQIFSFFF